MPFSCHPDPQVDAGLVGHADVAQLTIEM